jgi:Ala-tRNA(Pro) deacylase
LERGAKALVLECGEAFVLAVISAASKVDFRALKQLLGTKRVQMASAEKVRAVTGCEPGGVPPFGHFFGLRVIVDPSLLENEWIDFNAGERTRSVEMRAQDYVQLSGAEVLPFAQG